MVSQVGTNQGLCRLWYVHPTASSRGDTENPCSAARCSSRGGRQVEVSWQDRPCAADPRISGAVSGQGADSDSDDDIGVEPQTLDCEADDGIASDTDEDPDDQDELNFLIPGFSPILDMTQITFGAGLIGKRVAYKFVRDSTVPDGWFVCTVTRKCSPSFQKKGFNYVIRFVKIGDFQLWPRGKGTEIDALLVEPGYGVEKGHKWVCVVAGGQPVEPGL
mmetsp:Transcript_28602/g.67747  ORF Transcript_28602/g.67747 Transcript_28602/m.67747 type:complete len:219 (-) Transcript_28602:122-778(-)